MRRNRVVAFVAALAVSSSVAAGGPAKAAAAADPAIVEFLLTSSAKDFKASGAPVPTAIRGARIGHFAESGQDHHLLCGAFKSGSGALARWTPFATIKTSDYEQWLGGAARSYCAQPTIRWAAGDHSAALMQRLTDAPAR